MDRGITPTDWRRGGVWSSRTRRHVYMVRQRDLSAHTCILAVCREQDQAGGAEEALTIPTSPPTPHPSADQGAVERAWPNPGKSRPPETGCEDEGQGRDILGACQFSYVVHASLCVDNYEGVYPIDWCVSPRLSAKSRP